MARRTARRRRYDLYLSPDETPHLIEWINANPGRWQTIARMVLDDLCRQGALTPTFGPVAAAPEAGQGMTSGAGESTPAPAPPPAPIQPEPETAPPPMPQPAPAPVPAPAPAPIPQAQPEPAPIPQAPPIPQPVQSPPPQAPQSPEDERAKRAAMVKELLRKNLGGMS